MNLAKKIRAIREKKKMTMKETAKKVGVSVSTYRDWEYGRKIPASRISKIAKALAISTNELLEELSKKDSKHLEQAIFLIEEALKSLKKIAG